MRAGSPRPSETFPSTKSLLLWLAVAAALLAAGTAAHAGEPAKAPPAPPAGDPALRDLAVLYAGDPDDERPSKFKAFLEPRVGRYASISLRDLDAEAARGFDVVVADWHRRYGPDGCSDECPHGVTLPRGFRTPVVAVGAVAGEVTEEWSKLRWAGQSLGNEAYDLRPEHPVFRGPLPVAIDWAEVTLAPTECDHPLGRLPDTRRVWKVQTGTPGDDVDYGLVCDPYGFEDSPDAERIASGTNQEDAHALAIARHGNFFLWGFAADPSRMTESGGNAFLNLLVYAKGFAGRTATVERKALSREWALVYATYLRAPGCSERTRDWLRTCFCDAARAATDLESQRLQEFAAREAGYLHPAGHGFEVDGDLRTLGAPNREVAFFEKTIERLRADPRDLVALRLLDRYASDVAAPADATQLATWLERNRERLFFSDVGGYRWFLADR